LRLKNKTAIVTGAASGMGKAMAELFAKEGAYVVVVDLNETGVQQTVEAIQSQGGIANGIALDLSSPGSAEIILDKTLHAYGRVDILVNNAGIMDNFETAGEATDELWEKVLQVNLTAPFKLSRAVIKTMEKQKNGGVIINNASVGGLFGARGGAAYVTSKHGLIGLTKNIAATYGFMGKIRANAIAPGGVNTNIGSTITDPSPLGLKAINGLGEVPMGEPEQIAQLALFLAEDGSGFINGAVISADGGWTCR
jgi:NAD(P)-dependent dehydrogenase (short-subunit alcohol dehydrogenase family)